MNQRKITQKIYTYTCVLYLFAVENCTQAAIDDFPNDLFTQEQRQNGAVVLHVIASLYLFAALAVVCDKYFVPAVDKMCNGKQNNLIIQYLFPLCIGLRLLFPRLFLLF